MILYFKRVMVLVVLFAGIACGYAESSLLVELGRERIALENELRSRAEELFKKRFGVSEVIIRIDAVPFLSVGEMEQEAERRFVLPGVPVAEEVMSAREAPAMRYFLRRMIVKLYLPEDFPEEEIPAVRTFLTELLHLDYDRGDVLNIENTLAASSGIDLYALLENPQTYRISGLLLAFVFLLGPVGSYLKQAKRQIAITSIQGRNALDIGGPESGTVKKITESRESKYFSFVNSGNLSRMLHVLENEPVEATAILCEHLPDEYLSWLLSRLPGNKKWETVRFMSKVNFLPPEKISETEKRLRAKVENVVGGEESVLRIFRDIDSDEQEKMVAATAEVNPALAEKLKSSMISFEDILGFDSAALIPVVRKSGVAIVARALKGQDKEALAGLKKKLPAGMSRMIEEELSYLPEIDEKEVALARKELIKNAYGINANI